MACVQLRSLTKEDGQSDQCPNEDWHLQAPTCQKPPSENEGKTRTVAVAVECCERCRKATQRATMATPCQAPLSPLSPECTTVVGQVVYHPSLSKEDKEAAPKRSCCCESETSFICVDENVNNLDHTGSLAHRGCCQDQGLLPYPNPCEEVASEWPYDPPSLVSEEEEDADSEASGGKSVDYGFISAILFLVSGILLVIVSYVVPRDVTVDRSTVAAREMERLENESAKVGAHLDRCVIAGLCLLTLGGVVLSSLLMISMWKGELYRRHRFASSKESAKLYGSFNFRMKSSANDNMELSLVEEDVLAIES